MLTFNPFSPGGDSQLLIDAVFDDGMGIQASNITFVGADGQSSLFNDPDSSVGLGSGLLLTTGTGSPALNNTSTGFTVGTGGPGDADLDAAIALAFSAAGATQDANSLEFTFTNTDPTQKTISFDLVFASDEFPEFADSSFVDIAGVFVNGDNVALFDQDPLQPLSILSANIDEGLLIDNQGGQIPIEYDGVSVRLQVSAPVNLGDNTVKIAVADTGDDRLDSGLFVSNVRLVGDTAGGGINLPPVAADDTFQSNGQNDLVLDLLANDSDDQNMLDGVSIVSEPSNGSVTVNADGTVTYTPGAGFTGSDSFEYAAVDAQGALSDPASVTIAGAGTDPADPSGGNGLKVTFVSEDAAFDNVYGFYRIGSDGKPTGEAEVLFSNVSDDVLNPGDSKTIDGITDTSEVGFFLIRNGANLGIDFDDGAVSIASGKLTHTASDGTTTVLQPYQLHLDTEAGQVQISGNEYAWEDKSASEGSYDGDFNDAVFSVEVVDGTPSPAPDGDDQMVTSPGTTLPDGQEVAISITTEATTDDDTAELSGAISLTGLINSSFNIAYIMDRSGSTGSTARDQNGDALDLNGDGTPDSVLDVQKLAFAELNQDLIDNGLGSADLGVSVFSSSATPIVETQVAADDDGNGIADGLDLLNSFGDGGGTDFSDGLDQAIAFFQNQADAGTSANVLYFLSDGQSGGSVDAQVQQLGDLGVTVNAIGVGSNADEATLDSIDNTGGAQIITDLSQLAAGLSGSSLDINDILSVEISVNGVVQETLDSSAFIDTPTGPQFGPVTLTGLDPASVNNVDIEAKLETDDGQQFDLNLMTTIVGTASADSLLTPPPADVTG